MTGCAQGAAVRGKLEVITARAAAAVDAALTDLLEQEPGCAAAHLAIAEHSIKQGRPEEAVRAARRALKIAKGDPRARVALAVGLGGRKGNDITAIVRHCHQRGIKVLVINYPEHGIEQCRGWVVKVISSIARSRGIPVLELSQHMTRRVSDDAPSLFTDDYHPNARGYGIIAREAFRYMQQVGWLEPAR